MHCVLLAIFSHLSRFHPPAVGSDWPSCVDVLLNTKQTGVSFPKYYFANCVCLANIAIDCLFSGVSFPKNYFSIVKKIMTRLFRVFVHVYIHHFDKLVGLGAVSIATVFQLLVIFHISYTVLCWQIIMHTAQWCQYVCLVCLNLYSWIRLLQRLYWYEIVFFLHTQTFSHCTVFIRCCNTNWYLFFKNNFQVPAIWVYVENLVKLKLLTMLLRFFPVNKVGKQRVVLIDLFDCYWIASLE